MSEKVVQFPGAESLPENPISITPAPFGFCNHELITLDEHRRLVICSQCDRAIDPYDYLLGNARTLQRAWTNYAELQRRASAKVESIEALERTEKNLKAKVARLKEKVPPINTRSLL